MRGAVELQIFFIHSSKADMLYSLMVDTAESWARAFQVVLV